MDADLGASMYYVRSALESAKFGFELLVSVYFKFIEVAWILTIDMENYDE